MAGQRDVFGRWLVRVQPMRVRVVDAQEFETALAEFHHQSRELLGRNQVIPNRISRDVLRGESPGDYVVLACQNSAAFTMRLAAGMGKELAKHFAATLDGAFHSTSLTSPARSIFTLPALGFTGYWVGNGFEFWPLLKV
jgi:hypothetical protein